MSYLRHISTRRLLALLATTVVVLAASLQGSDPLLTGAKGRLWATGDKLRLELQASSADGRAGDVQVLLNGDQLTVIETATNTVYRAKLPQDAQNGSEPVPSLARIQGV